MLAAFQLVPSSQDFNFVFLDLEELLKNDIHTPSDTPLQDGCFSGETLPNFEQSHT